ncbi:MAG: hypothetical protein Q4A97_09920 [Comamonadaceae bacterium]|nr:hypothetical protein [Comamonadaceae bacterium]
MNSIKRLFLPLSLSALFFLALLSMPAAQAFDYGYKADNYFYTWHIDDAMRRDMLRNQQNKYRKTYDQAKSKSSADDKQEAAEADRYSHSSRLSQKISEQMVQTLRKKLQSNNQLTPQAEKGLSQLANANLIGQVRQALKADGYYPDSVAVAMAYWVLVNYGIAQQTDFSKIKGHGLVRQLQAAMSKGEVAAASHAEKQEMAEVLYWMGSLQVAMYMEAQQQKNQQAIEALVSEAKAALDAMGLGVDGIGQGRNGLELR